LKACLPTEVEKEGGKKHPKISTNDIFFGRLWGADGGSRP
jgi:hypothetical protein